MNAKSILPRQPESETPQPPMVYVKEKAAWEYKQLIIDADTDQTPTEDELNKLGAEGWELVGVYTDPPHITFTFKRPAE